MATAVIHPDRIKRLNDKELAKGDYTLYWMQQSQRAEQNHALEFAIQRANDKQNRLLVAFALDDSYPEANLRHFCFMLQGLAQVHAALKARNIRLVVQRGNPENVVLRLAKNATEVVCDRGYLNHLKAWRSTVARQADCRVWQVESDVLVPVDCATPKREFAARTIRPKLNNLVDEYLEELRPTPIDKNSLNLRADGLEISKINKVLAQLRIDKTVSPAGEFIGGTAQAKSWLKNFLEKRLNTYDQRATVIEPSVSYLSPYLHFGQISSNMIYFAVNAKKEVRKSAKNAFLEELLVRRELAINFVHRESNYDSLTCLPDWASKTLQEHESDEREYIYSYTQFESAETHDEAWNAAMTEMKYRGYLHNHLRMYWGKKIIEWTNTYNHAYRTALKLNNKYLLDGRDANSYANVGWLFGLHDRAFQERKVLGKLRYMSRDGLQRKLDIDKYIKAITTLYGNNA